MSSGELWVAIPLICLLTGAFSIYLIARLITRRNEVLALLTSGVFAATLATLLELGRRSNQARRLGLPGLIWGSHSPNGAALQADAGAIVISTVAVALGLCVAVYCGRYLALDHRYKVTYPLLLLLVAGLLGMVMATDLFGLYLFCELMSVPAYVLVAFRRHTDTAVEAGFKYLIMGSVGTLTLLMGMTLVYRETGSLALQQAMDASGPWAQVGLACMLAGLGLKSAIVPGHTWLPDAHGRAPSSISAMLSGIVIQSTFYAWLKVSLGLGYPAESLGTLLILLSVLNMTVGNSLALVQTHTKRLLAYSTIAQMGYVMFAIGVGLRYDIPGAIQAGFFLMVAHAAMKGLAFLSKGICHFYLHTTLIDELRGTSQRLPLVAATFTLALASLAGIPPLAGFAGKWFILAQILQTEDWVIYAGLAIFLANTVLSLAYYLPLIATLFSSPDPVVDTTGVRISAWMAIPVVVLGLLVLAIGLWPGPWMEWTGHLITTVR